MSKASQQRATSTRREQLRAQQLAEAKRKQNQMRIIYVLCGVVALALVAIVATVVISDRNEKKEQAAREAAAQIDPPNATADRTAIAWNPAKAGDVPVLTIYEDFQCPACKSAESYFGETITKLAEAGKIKVEYRVLTFLDTNLRNDSSERAARAAACADVVGKFKQYHDVVYTNQPEEGLGFTDDQLRVQFAQQAGITGADLTKFQQCYDDKATAKWVRESFEAAKAGWQNSTPQFDINGKVPPQVKNEKGEMTDWWRVLEPTEESWMEAITANA